MSVERYVLRVTKTIVKERNKTKINPLGYNEVPLRGWELDEGMDFTPSSEVPRFMWFTPIKSDEKTGRKACHPAYLLYTNNLPNTIQLLPVMIFYVGEPKPKGKVPN